jgi:nucleoside-diphosphate-sugar epimerase
VSMKVLYIGGTGEISPGCIQASLALGNEVSVFNRGRSGEPLPQGATQILGDVNDADAYRALGRHGWDAVCQFRSFTVDDAVRDVDVFAGNTRQFVFVSTASAYQKPPRTHRITEHTPLENPFWDYSRQKAEAEAVLMKEHAAGRLPVTIVRPSHTNRAKFPSTFISGDHHAWRLLHGKPILSHGDGSGLWVLTRCEDFGAAFARLLGNPKALGEAFHITSDETNTWDRIFEAMAESLGVEARLAHVASDTLIQYNREWEGPLLGDKACSVEFDNAKVRQAVGDWRCRYTMRDAIALAAPHVKKRLATFQPDPAVDALIDRIIVEQRALR